MFFIIGSQRSGTTLMRLILNSHPDLVVYDEEESHKRIEKNIFPSEKTVGLKVPVYTYGYNYLPKLFPCSKFVFMKRDVKAIACSMLTLKFANIPWIKKYGIEDLKRTIKEVSDNQLRKVFQQKLDESLKINDLVSMAVLCAYVKSYFINEYSKAGLEVIEVEYESLVNNPREEIKKVLDFIGVSWDDKVLRHHSSNYGISIGKTDNSRPIDSNSVNKWQVFFSDKEVEKINRLVSELDKNK